MVLAACCLLLSPQLTVFKELSKLMANEARRNDDVQ